MAIKLIADNVAVITNPKPLLNGNNPGAQFIIGGTDHPLYAFTSMERINSVARVICWGRIAEVALRHFHKGCLIDVLGVFYQRSWEQEVGKVIVAECRAQQVRLVRPSNVADLMELSPLVEEILQAWDQADAIGDPDNAMLSCNSPEDDKAPTPPRREDAGRRYIVG